MTIRVVFLGSPQFATPTLQALAGRYRVIGVVTQPDRPAGRGQQLAPPPVKTLAERLGLPVIQPRRLREPAAIAQLQEWRPELIVVAAFGQILRPEVLNLPSRGCINVHASLLPRWRGAAPIQAAILNGDRETGITIMQMDPGVDTGAILAQRAMIIQENDTAGTLSERLAALGAELLLESLPGFLEGRLLPKAQDDSLATYAPMLNKEDGLLDFSQPAESLERRVRAMQPWPGAHFIWQGERLKVLRVSLAEVPASLEQDQPGKTLRWAGKPALRAADGLLVLEEVQPAGKRRLTGKEFLQGAKNWGT
jgi:methionyl-tRNA formyltransferase